MEIFNIFSISEPFKTGASGSGIGIPYTIQYNMSIMGIELDGTKYIRNYGKGGNSFNAEAFASNNIYLNGTTQSVPYPITSGIEVCYYDVAAKAFVKDTASNPYTMTTSHSSLFSSTITITDDDLAELTADPNKIYRIKFGSETLESGFSNTDIGNFYGGNGGNVLIGGGEFIQDFSVSLGANDGTPVKSIDGTGNTIIHDGNDTFTIHQESVTTVVYRPFMGMTAPFEANKLFVFTAIINVTNGQTKVFRIEMGDSSGVGISIDINETIGIGEHIYSAIAYRRTDEKANLLMDGSIDAVSDFTVNLTVREASVAEIQNYDSTCLTTLENQSNGASNLKLIQNPSGRTTGIAAANTTQWKADGRTAVTGWTITAPFTITEEIDGDTYDFTSDGNRYKNTVADGTYTLPTGVWTLYEFGFDGATPVVARGNTKMIDEVVVP